MTAPAASRLRFSELAGYHPQQRKAMEALRQYQYVFYGGARGGGKSRWLRWALVHLLFHRAKHGIRRARAMLCCEDYPTLEDRQISKIEREFPRWLGQLKDTKSDGLGFYLHEDYGGGVLLLRNLDDPSKYAGAEMSDLGIDELTRCSYDTFQTLRGSLRWPGVDDPHFLGASMPGGPGHLWVKSLWIDELFPEELESIKDRFVFIPATVYDNPHASDSYVQMLKTQPEATRRAWLEGDWNVFEGQAFTEWRDAIHIVRGRVTAPPHWRWVAGMDWGYRANGWIGLTAVGPGPTPEYPRLYLHWEWVFKQRHAKEVGALLGHAFQHLPRPEWIAADEQMWYKTGATGPTLAEELTAGLKEVLGQATIPVVAAPHGPGSRLTKKQLMHRALAWTPSLRDPSRPAKGGRPLLQVHERCKYFIRTIPSLPYDKTKVEDIDTKAEDHGYDGFGNILLARLPQADPAEAPLRQDQHPGFTREGRRRRQTATPVEELDAFLDEARVAASRHGVPGGVWSATRTQVPLEEDL